MTTNDSKSPRSIVAEHVKNLPRSGIRDFFDIVSTMKDVISLGIGEPDFDTPWHVRESTVFSIEKGATHYTSNLGLLELREALSAYVNKRIGVNYNPETEILITVGVSEALDLALRALINPGDDVLFHKPCYVSYESEIILAHGNPIAVETSRENDFRVTRAMLESAITPNTKVLMLNYPNNPTGAILEPQDIKEIAEFAIERDLVVITDEIYAELTYDHDHISIASMPGMKERTIYLHGFSKAWAMTGYRLGYACSTPELTEAMMKIHQYSMLCASSMAQKGAIEALSKPEDDINEMADEYKKRRNFVYQSFQDMGISCPLARGAFYMFPYIGDTGLSSKDFALKLLDEENVAVVPGTAFGECGEGYVRCAYATSMDNLKEAMVRIKRFVERHRG